MSWTKWVTGAVALTALVSVAFFMRPSPIPLHNMSELKAKLATSGFACTTDTAHGRAGTGFLVSREPVAWDEAGGLCKTGVMGKEWKGKVWVTLNPHNYRLETVPDEAGTRVWGEILAFGDTGLLDDIDHVLVESPRLPF